MRTVLFLTVVGVAAGLPLVAPSTSQAQVVGPGYRGPGSYCGGPTYSGYGSPYDRGYAPNYGGYSGFRGGVYSPGYYGRQVIEHPTYGHWTPFRGYHEHGHIHVPHRGHYDTYQY